MLIVLIVHFLFFYFGCYFFDKNLNRAKISAFVFVLISFFIRVIIPLEWNADFSYYSHRNYDFEILKPLNDVMVSLLYNVMFYFTNSKELSVKLFSYLVFVLSTSFYVWLIFTQLPKYKKIFLFALTYFLFTFTLLRNGPGYELVFLYFYYLFNKNKTFFWLLFLAVTFHYSSIIAFFCEIKFKYLKVYLPISLLLFFAFVKILNVDVSIFTIKLMDYFNNKYDFNLNHFLWFIMVLGFYVLIYLENNEKGILKRALFFLVAYLIAILFNPVLAFRVSFYFILFYCSIPVIKPFFTTRISYLNRLSLLFVVFHVIAFIKCHKAVNMDVMLFSLSS